MARLRETAVSGYGRAMVDAPVTLVVIDDAPEVRLFVKSQLRRSGQFMVVGEGGTA